ncbi:DUF2264 domain-containing protein [Actinomyces glycerinitolerans]|nr:DUF2264 domain-containing protein [Actinomyces glycerinitolerans]
MEAIMGATTSNGNVADMTRGQWERWADALLLAVRPYFTPGHARLELPGPTSSYGSDSDGLEGFARTFLLAGFRLAGASRATDVDVQDPYAMADWYRVGLVSGTTPGGQEAWPTLSDCAQAKVEAASIALILDMTRPLIWERLAPTEKRNVIAWLAPAVGDDSYPRCNWLWFRVIVETFLRSVGGPWSETDIRADLAEHDSYYRGHGWFSDGPERSFDYYVGWAMHLYPILWARMSGASDFAAERGQTDVKRLERYLEDFVTLIGGDGAPLFQGRSLIYRFAAAAPLWVGAIAGVENLEMGLLRHGASAIVDYFRRHGVPDEQGLLTLGWFAPWEPMRQSYSGAGSPYWASKGALGLALPGDHPVWTSQECPLPVEVGNVLRAVDAPGWIVSATSNDGIVRVINHGTDHAREGDSVADSPLYARIGYSTVTTPCLDVEAETNPLEMSAALLDASGDASHRAGMVRLAIGVTDGVGYAASRAQSHWVKPDSHQQGHGSGAVGRMTYAGMMTVVSLVHAEWELRLVRVDRPSERVVAMRVGGWALTGDGPESRASAREASVSLSGLSCRVVAADGIACDPMIYERTDASPLPGVTTVPVISAAVVPGTWRAFAICLAGEAAADAGRVPVVDSLVEDGEDLVAVVTWPSLGKVVTRCPVVVPQLTAG